MLIFLSDDLTSLVAGRARHQRLVAALLQVPEDLSDFAVRHGGFLTTLGGFC